MMITISVELPQGSATCAHLMAEKLGEHVRWIVEEDWGSETQTGARTKVTLTSERIQAHWQPLRKVPMFQQAMGLSLVWLSVGMVIGAMLFRFARG